MLAMLEPTTLLIAIAGALFKAALRLTKSSGIEVAKDTTVIPITNFDMLSLNESATDDLTKYSPPTTKSIKPKISQTTLMQIIFCEDKIRLTNNNFISQLIQISIIILKWSQ